MTGCDLDQCDFAGRAGPYLFPDGWYVPSFGKIFSALGKVERGKMTTLLICMIFYVEGHSQRRQPC